MGVWFWVTMEQSCVSEDNVGNSSPPSSEVVVTQTSESRRTYVASPHKKSKNQNHGQRRRREDEVIEINQQDENQDEIEQIVDRIFAGTNSDVRSSLL